MKKISFVLFLMCSIFLVKAQDYTQYVNPLMGTQSTFELSTGNTYPAIATPWGMNFWSPRTSCGCKHRPLHMSLHLGM